MFLNLPLSTELARTLNQELKDYNHSITISTAVEGCHYILVGRYRGKQIQYAWVLPNSNTKNETNSSLPLRTQWQDTHPIGMGLQKTAEFLNDSILQLERIRAWHQLSAPPDNGRFPYHLALKNANTHHITTTGPLMEGETYGLILRANPDPLTSQDNIEKRYVYVFSIDNYGKASLLFPGQWKRNSENYFPARIDMQLESEIRLGEEKCFSIGAPFGVDTFILLSTVEPISNPAVLSFNGVRKEDLPEALTPLEVLLYDLSSVSRNRNSHLLSTNWSIERLPILSQPATKKTAHLTLPIKINGPQK